MLRWWTGIAILALLLLGPGLAAQPTGVPACDLAARQAELNQGILADFSKCTVADASRLLAASGYTPKKRDDKAATGLPAETITHQTHDGLEVYLWAASGEGYSPPPAADPVRFSLKAPREVAEGGKFTLTINRNRDDGQPHILGLEYHPGELLTDAPATFTFSGNDSSATIPLQAAPGTSGDGEKSVVIVLTVGEGASLGKPSQLPVTITDTRAPQSYTVTTRGEVRHDAPITFVVTRTDLADPVHPTYDLNEDGNLLRQGKEVVFADGQPNWQIQVDPGEYGHCTKSVEFVLHTAGGDQPVDAAFADAIPADCTPPPLWPKVVGGLTVIVLIGIGLYTWPWFPPKPDDGSTPTRLLPTITAHANFDPPRIPPLILGERALRWPGATAQVRIEPGDTHLPDPLPVETDDHG